MFPFSQVSKQNLFSKLRIFNYPKTVFAATCYLCSLHMSYTDFISFKVAKLAIKPASVTHLQDNYICLICWLDLFRVRTVCCGAWHCNMTFFCAHTSVGEDKPSKGPDQAEKLTPFSTILKHGAFKPSYYTYNFICSTTPHHSTAQE